MAICIEIIWIVWVHEQFPAGDWPDINIVWSSINLHVADAGGHQWAKTQTGTHDYERRTYALVRARNETGTRETMSAMTSRALC